MIIPQANRLDQVSTYYFAQKLAEIDQMNKDGGEQVINLGIGSPDLMPPQSVIDTLYTAYQKEGAHKYQSYRGIPALRQAFVYWYNHYFDVVLHSDTEILPLIGSKEGIMHISMAFLNPGDQVLVPNPGYPAYRAISSICGAEIITYTLTPETGWLPNLDELESQDLSNVKIMWVNYPHMPTGARATRSFFDALIQFGKRNQILICHDNPYTFILNEDPVSIMQSREAKEVALELTSLSKNYNMAGWRVGAVAGAKAYLDTILKFKSNMDSGMFKPIQEAAVEALRYGDHWQAELNEAYHIRRNVAWEIMDLIDCTYDKDAVGLFVWGKVPDNIGHATELCDKYLYDARVFITPGHIFGSAGDRYVRISLCADVPLLHQAKTKIEKMLKPSVV